MRRWLILPTLLAAALAFAAVGAAHPGEGHGKGNKSTGKGGQLTFTVTTVDHGCGYRPWAMDKLTRKYKVRKNQDGSYTIRRQDKGVFTTTGPQSPSADPCPGVIRHGKHGTLLKAGITGKIHGYIQGTLTGGTFNPNGTCTAECTNTDFVKGFFTPTAGSTVRYTCLEGYAGCRFSFAYTTQRQNTQKLLYHHWVDRGTNGVTEEFIGDIATS